jgi:sporulation protein YlmC with PRC-barrel domain
LPRSVAREHLGSKRRSLSIGGTDIPSGNRAVIPKDEPLEYPMIRTLLTTTALVALLSTGALAQESAPATPPATPPADSGAVPPVGGIDGAATFTLSQGYTPAGDDNLASRIIGTQVYTGTGDDAEVIGDVNDLVLDSDGSIAAVVVGVGGFLGVGEKNVAVAYSDLQWSTAEDGSDRAVLATSKDDLATAPDFIWPPDASEATQPLGDTGADNDAGNAMAPATDTSNEDAAVTPNANDTTNISPDMTTDQPDSAMGAPDPSKMTPLDEATLTADDLKGIGVFGQNDEQIGTIGDLVVDADGKIDAVVVDVGGFLGVGSKPVAVGFDNLQFAVDASNQRYLFLNATKEQLDKQPQFNKDTYPQERDAQRLVVNPNG